MYGVETFLDVAIKAFGPNSPLTLVLLEGDPALANQPYVDYLALLQESNAALKGK